MIDYLEEQAPEADTVDAAFDNLSENMKLLMYLTNISQSDDDNNNNAEYGGNIQALKTFHHLDRRRHYAVPIQIILIQYFFPKLLGLWLILLRV